MEPAERVYAYACESRVRIVGIFRKFRQGLAVIRDEVLAQFEYNRRVNFKMNVSTDGFRHRSPFFSSRAPSL